jgi:hypothetical protein
MATVLGAIGAKALFGGAAAIGAAAIGSRASGKAADAQVQGQQGALQATNVAANQARGEVNRLFGESNVSRDRGFTQAQDFLGGAIGSQIQPFQQGNMMAQEQVARGLPQIQNAILGNPVDLTGFNARQIGQPSDFNIDLAQFRPQPEATPAPAVAPAAGFNIQEFRDRFSQGNGIFNAGINGRSGRMYGNRRNDLR